VGRNGDKREKHFLLPLQEMEVETPVMYFFLKRHNLAYVFQAGPEPLGSSDPPCISLLRSWDYTHATVLSSVL
jgi:hypothetical protein